MKAKITVEVTNSNRNEFRSFLNRMKSRYGLEYVEKRTVDDSQFMIRGNYDLMIKLSKTMKKYGTE